MASSLHLGRERTVIDIRAAHPTDLDAILEVHRAAFGSEDEPELTRALLGDPAAAPAISLVAVDEAIVGHILFTPAEIEGQPELRSMMVAPLGVVPDRQRQGVGSMLARRAIDQAKDDGVDLVFLAGHPDYYPRFGFQTRAEELGISPPFPMPPTQDDAWMVLELTPGAIGRASGRVIAAAGLMDPSLWEGPPDAV